MNIYSEKKGFSVYFFFFFVCNISVYIILCTQVRTVATDGPEDWTGLSAVGEGGKGIWHQNEDFGQTGEYWMSADPTNNFEHQLLYLWFQLYWHAHLTNGTHSTGTDHGAHIWNANEY